MLDVPKIYLIQLMKSSQFVNRFDLVHAELDFLLVRV